MDRNDTPTEKPKARIPSAVSVKLGRLPPLQRALLWGEEETGFEEKVEVVEVDVPPHKFETGTKNHEGLAGTTAAINYLADLRAEIGAPFADEYPGFEGRRLHLKTAMASIRAYERSLAERFGHAGIFDWDGNYNVLAAAWLLLNERLRTSWQGLGAVLVIAAVTLYVRHPTRPATFSEPRQSR